MNNFTLIRHGEAAYNLADQYKLIGGAREWVPLTQKGIQQINQLCHTFKNEPIDALITSPITRAMHTASILSHGLNLSMTVEFDLHEWLPDRNFRYASSAQVLTAFDELLSLNGEWPENETRDWEPMSALRRRVYGVLHRYRQFDHVLVVCHGAIIRELHGKPIEVSQYCQFQLPD